MSRRISDEDKPAVAYQADEEPGGVVVHTIGNAVILDEPVELQFMSSEANFESSDANAIEKEDNDWPYGTRPPLSREASSSTVVGHHVLVPDPTKLRKVEETDEVFIPTERPCLVRGLSEATLHESPEPFRATTRATINTADVGEELERVATLPLEDWNKPRINIARLSAAFLGFCISGMKDSVMGVLIPELEQDYNTSYLIVSIALISPALGYTVSSLVNDYLHRRVGRRGVCIIGPCFELIFYIVAATRPPFPLYVTAFAFAGMGCGLLDGCWNTMVGGFKNSSQILCVLHGFYGLGGILCPTIATPMLGRGISWNFIYVILAGLGICLLSLCLIAFRHDSPEVYMLSIARPSCDSEVKRSAVGDALRNRLVILLSLTVLLYVGGEVGSGSWMTTYMINVRHGSRDSMGYVSTGYWAGLTLGRLGFSFLNARLSRYLEFLFIFYLGCAMLFCILAWTIPIIIVSAVAIAFLGMFLGPIFPTMVGVAVRKLPRRLHVSGIGFAATFGGAGAAAIPFVIGVVTDTAGAKVIPPTILAFLIAAMVIWVTIIKFC